MIYEVFLSDPDIFFEWIEVICLTRADAEECVLTYKDDYAYHYFCRRYYEDGWDLEEVLKWVKYCDDSITIREIPVW